MIKRVIEISRESVDLTVADRQLELRFNDPDREDVRIPCEDIGVLVVDNRDVTYSHSALRTILESGAAVVMCGRDHLPAGMLLPWSNHTEVVTRLREQIAVSKPLKKRLWQQLISAKIRAQAGNLDASHGTATQLRAMARRVRSGDPDNLEAQAAKAYWGAWRSGFAETFRRDPNRSDPINIMLNYGYAIIRAGVARAIVGAGLQPALGVHHANRSNAFCLADDVMEPLRPMTDACVKALYMNGERKLVPPVKRELLSVLTQTVETAGTTGPLMVALERVAASVAGCYRDSTCKLVIPRVIRCET